jgi:hypothetical protein
MSAAEVLVYGAITIIIVFVSVYFSLLLRGAANDRVISEAVASMLAARQRQDIPPQRQLLRTITQTLADQERAAARIGVAVGQSQRTRPVGLSPRDVVTEILSLQEPQLLVTDFFAEHAGDSGSAGLFAAFAGQLVRTETRRVYADLDGDASPGLGRLLALAMEGRVAPVAQAGLEMHSGPRQAHAPLLTDGDHGAVERVVRGLEQATRRQLRLAVLLHSQAAATLQLRVSREERAGEAIWTYLRRRTRGGSDEATGGRDSAGLRLRLHRLLAAPRLKLQRARFEQADLDSLEVVFDSIGEAVTSALEGLAEGEPMRAIYLLTGIRVPVPAGLPGRVYNQDSLAQVRPLVALGVRHRLAVCRWAAVAMGDAALQSSFRDQAGLVGAWDGKRDGDE